MIVNGTLVNYYMHCKRQCYLHGNRINLEDNSEAVQIGKAIHEQKSYGRDDSEISIENIVIDKITREYVIETKKSDADVEASKWQLLFYLKKLKDKGIERKGKLEFVEKNKKENKKIMIFELTEEDIVRLDEITKEIEVLVNSDVVPEINETKSCKKCAYYEYCYI